MSSAHLSPKIRGDRFLTPKQERAAALPAPTLATVFEFVIGGRVYRVAGSALQRWIVERRIE